jgi:hypothetical protein
LYIEIVKNLSMKMSRKYAFDKNDYLVEVNPNRKYYVKVYLKNIYKYYFYENLTLEEAQKIKEEQIRKGRKPKIIKYETK